jgi:hypothetical protein
VAEIVSVSHSRTPSIRLRWLEVTALIEYGVRGQHFVLFEENGAVADHRGPIRHIDKGRHSRIVNPFLGCAMRSKRAHQLTGSA